MTNNQTNYKKELDAIIKGMEDSIFALSEEEINAELIDMGEQPDKITEHVKNLFAEADKKYRQRHLIAAQKEVTKQRSTSQIKKINITQHFEKWRDLVMNTLKAKPEYRELLTIQNRNFEDLPDEDVKSLFKHLVKLEIIREEDLLHDGEDEQSPRI